MEKDFTPISNFGTVPIAIGINPGLPAKTLKEFIAAAKANPDKFTWGAEGVGSVGHLTMERLQREGGFKILIVHYRGTSPALVDLIAGRVSAMVSPVPNLIEQFRGGTVRPVAVATKARLATLPDVPTLEEQGFRKFRDRLVVRAVGTGQHAEGRGRRAERRDRRGDEDAARHRARGGAGADSGRVELRGLRGLPARRDRKIRQDDQGRQHQDRQLSMTQNIRRVGIVGLGKMGLPMARHLRKGGFEVAACDVSAAARTQAEAAGIKVVANPKAVAAESDFIVVVVGFDAEAEAVVLGADGIAAAARPGMIVGIASTVAPRTMQKIAAKFPARASRCSTCRSPAASPRPKPASS